MTTDQVDWNCPPPRKGFLGIIDNFVGPGATRGELLLQTICPVFATIGALLYAVNADLNWSLVQFAICGILTFDISGGIVTNSTSAGKRWYHRNSQGFWNHLSFTSLHLLHLFVVSWVFLDWNFMWILFSGGYLMAAAVVILSVRTYIQRPVAMISFGLSLVLSLYILNAPNGIEWFLPLFYLKLLVCHLVKETPYHVPKNANQSLVATPTAAS